MTRPNEKAETGASAERETPPPTPRWVKVFAVVVGVILAVVVVLHATGHGMHGH